MAIPQPYVPELQPLLGDHPAGQLVAGYHDDIGVFERLLPLTQEACDALLELAPDSESLLEDWSKFGLVPSDS